MVQLQQAAKTIEASGGQVAGISFDAVEVLQKFAQRRGIAFPLLSDPGSKTIDAYRIRNEEAEGRTRGIPHPGTFIVGRKGVVRSKFFMESYSDRHPPTVLAEALKAAR